MKNQFLTPELNVISLSSEIMTTSNGTELPILPGVNNPLGINELPPV